MSLRTAVKFNGKLCIQYIVVFENFYSDPECTAYTLTVAELPLKVQIVNSI